MKITLIGHVCVDRNVIRGVTETFYGGGVIHGAVTSKRLGAEVTVLTKCAEADREHFTSFRDAEVEVRFLPSAPARRSGISIPAKTPMTAKARSFRAAIPLLPVTSRASRPTPFI